MKLLVYPHQLVIGGSQINAIELAATVRDRGHEVTIVAPRGVLVPMIEDLGLRYIPTWATGRYASPRTALQLIDIVRRFDIDLVHGYEWRPAVEAAFGPHLVSRTPLLITVLSMSVPSFLPSHVPMVVGTRELMADAGAHQVHLMEPPIDTKANRSADPAGARAKWGFRPEETVISVVCRMTTELEKLQGVLAAADVMERLAQRWPVRLLAVGGGEGLEELKQRAGAINSRLGHDAIVVAGQVLDPREAYDAADIVLGMGSSVLRGMSFAKPVVVQGTTGFWRLLDEASLDTFLDQGWFGHGGGGGVELERILDNLIPDPVRRAELGAFGRQVVVDRFSLDTAADRLIELYERTIRARTAFGPWSGSMVRSAKEVAKFRVSRAIETIWDEGLRRGAG